MHSNAMHSNAMSDRIFVSNLMLRAHHGVSADETRLGQTFHIDIDCRVGIAEWAMTDDYSAAVCYGRLCKIAQETSEKGPYKLIETLGARIARTILDEFTKVEQVSVRIRKPSAPIAAIFDHVGVEITRSRIAVRSQP